jgi:hypothetical protein
MLELYLGGRLLLGVLGDRGAYRNIAILLMKNWTNLTNKQIGELFGGLSFSDVSKEHQRFSRKAKTDKALGRRIKKIMAKMSHVKGSDPIFSTEVPSEKNNFS